MSVLLTSLAKSAGCAAKIQQSDLRLALRGLSAAPDPRVLVGHDTSDDAAVIRLSDQLALVETVDIFPPIVDNPFDYGRIAAANALSDVYAMGAEPLNALSFIAWPIEKLGTETLSAVLRGAAAICQQAGITISGGHSIVDEEPKFGLFVTGTVHPDRVVTNAGARAGDRLVLTKPLGTGVLTTAFKRGAITVESLSEAVTMMATLNAPAAAAMIEVGVTAATDVTGFGLLGHLGNVLRASSATAGEPLGAIIEYAALPLFDRVESLLDLGLCPGGTRRNLQFAAPNSDFAPHLSESQHLLLADAQTSGGLLIAVPPERHQALIHSLQRHGAPVAATIGEVRLADRPSKISVV